MPVLTRRQAQVLRPRYDLMNGLRLWFPFDDWAPGATIQDNVTGFGAFGTNENTNGSWKGGIVRDAFGRNGAYFSPSGTSNFKGIYLNSSVPHYFGSVTLSMWLYPDAYNGLYGNSVFTDWSNSNRNILLYTSTSGQLIANIGNGSNAQESAVQTSTATATTGRWTHFVFVVNGTSHLMYFNGTLDNTYSGSYSGGNTANTVSIGGNSANSGFDTAWKGLIDDFRIYNRALSASEVNALYARAIMPADIMLDGIMYSAVTNNPRFINFPMLGM